MAMHVRSTWQANDGRTGQLGEVPCTAQAPATPVKHPLGKPNGALVAASCPCGCGVCTPGATEYAAVVPVGAASAKSWQRVLHSASLPTSASRWLWQLLTGGGSAGGGRAGGGGGGAVMGEGEAGEGGGVAAAGGGSEGGGDDGGTRGSRDRADGDGGEGGGGDSRGGGGDGGGGNGGGGDGARLSRQLQHNWPSSPAVQFWEQGSWMDHSRSAPGAMQRWNLRACRQRCRRGKAAPTLQHICTNKMPVAAQVSAEVAHPTAPTAASPHPHKWLALRPAPGPDLPAAPRTAQCTLPC